MKVKKTVKSYTIYFTMLSFFLLISGCEEKTESTPIENNNFLIIDEEKTSLIYRNHCGGCHGQDLGSFVEREWLYGNSKKEVLSSIKSGYEQNGMPAYENTFSEEELNDLTNYILRETKGKTQEMLEAENPDISGLIKSDDLNFRLETITANIDGIPWGMVQLPNGEFLVTERSGKLYRITEERALIEISGLPEIVSVNQGGLLDIVLHPDFTDNSYVYFSYSKANPNKRLETTTTVARAVLNGNSLLQTEEIFIALPYLNSGRHYGSRLLFDQEGYLYVSVGDRGFRNDYPQTLNNFHGKVHRIKDDGQLPESNPFFNMQGAVSSTFTYGMRNPQGLTLHPVTGDIWEGEHGPRGGDEINILEAGNNYGWPVITHGINYNGTPISAFTEMEGIEQPIHYWTPSIAPCGMTFLPGNFYGKWQNDLFVGSLKFEYLHRLKMDGNVVIGQEELLNHIGRVRNVSVGNDGFMYILVQDPGRLIRLVPQQ